MNNFFKKINQKDVFIHATEGVWGLGVCAQSVEGFEKLCSLKGRGSQIPCVCLTSRDEDINQWVDFNHLTTVQWKFYQEKKFTFTTFLLPASKYVPSHCVRDGKVAIRQSQQDHIRELVHFFNSPILSSSANLTGYPPAKSLEEAMSLFPFLLVAPGELGSMGKPSAIYDLIEERYIRL